jgi:predicted DNA-binding antitoxin AbrB/MazE fold protein
MGTTIRMRVTRGSHKPLDKISLPEGREVTVTILDVPSAHDLDAFDRAAGGWKGSVDTKKLLKNIYADRLVSTRPKPRI